jgi:hypothetical protein
LDLNQIPFGIFTDHRFIDHNKTRKITMLTKILFLEWALCTLFSHEFFFGAFYDRGEEPKQDVGDM